jgi:pimeloyl-ACP methyl ester carboxylesterase
MPHAKEKSPYSYIDLIKDIVGQRSAERGVRVHDLKLQALRKRPTMKQGTWGTRPDGSPMTREEYELRLTEYKKGLPDLLFPPIDTKFTLKDADGNAVKMGELRSRRQQGVLTFPSAIDSPITANNTACAFVYPAEAKKAVVILPNLRAEERAFSRLAGLLSRFGYTCIEAVHPYHGRRHDPNDTTMVPGERLFSSNVHETLWSFSQGISDILALYLFLMREGFSRIGVIGTSIGSTLTIMSLANAEDYRAYLERRDPDLVRDVPDGICRAVVINLSGGLLSDFIVDADNIEASYVRKGLIEDLGLTGPDIEHIWPEADPLRFVRKINMPVLSVKARQDPVLLYRYAKRQREFFAGNAVGGKNFTEFYIPVPAGHYSATYFLPKMFLGIADLLFILRHV